MTTTTQDVTLPEIVCPACGAVEYDVDVTLEFTNGTVWAFWNCWTRWCEVQSFDYTNKAAEEGLI